jgi:Zn-dependent alcohol dehydrogenase
MVLGHEAAGVVEEAGPGVTDLARGDAVALVFVPSCGHCAPCREGSKYGIEEYLEIKYLCFGGIA